MSKLNTKVSVIGAGAVGATAAFSLATAGLASELVVVDLAQEKALGEVMDMSHCADFIRPASIVSGDYEATKDSDIVVVTAGAAQKPGETRIDLVNKNVKIFQSIIPEVVKYSPNSILLIVSNPVDILSLVAYQISGFPKERVLGSGTVLDTSRYKYEIGKLLDINPQHIQGNILGEHGDTEFASWNTTFVQGVPIDEFAKHRNVSLTDEVKKEIESRVKNAAYEVINRKGNTSYAIGMSITRIVKAILHNEKSVLPISTLIEDYNGIDNVYLSLPAIVGRKGLIETIPVELKEEELHLFKASAKALQDVVASCQE